MRRINVIFSLSINILEAKNAGEFYDEILSLCSDFEKIKII